jgi:hypothetical protein
MHLAFQDNPITRNIVRTRYIFVRFKLIKAAPIGMLLEGVFTRVYCCLSSHKRLLARQKRHWKPSHFNGPLRFSSGSDFGEMTRSSAVLTGGWAWLPCTSLVGYTDPPPSILGVSWMLLESPVTKLSHELHELWNFQQVRCICFRIPREIIATEII